jgi:hypothetical protein
VCRSDNPANQRRQNGTARIRDTRGVSARRGVSRATASGEDPDWSEGARMLLRSHRKHWRRRMPRRQRFKPSRKPKPAIEPSEEIVTQTPPSNENIDEQRAEATEERIPR